MLATTSPALRQPELVGFRNPAITDLLINRIRCRIRLVGVKVREPLPVVEVMLCNVRNQRAREAATSVFRRRVHPANAYAVRGWTEARSTGDRLIINNPQVHRAVGDITVCG